MKMTWWEWLIAALIALILYAVFFGTHQAIKDCEAKGGIYIGRLNACAKKGGAFL